MIELLPVETDADAETFVRLRNEIHPRVPVSAEAFATIRARPRRLDLVAVLDGEPVGVGSVEDHWVDPDGPVASASVRVLPYARRRGVGTALLTRLAGDARGRGQSRLYTVVPEDDGDSLAYFGRRGWERVLEMQGVALDLRTARVRDDSSQAATVVPLDEALDPAVYEAAAEVEHDLQTAGPMRTIGFERWRARQFSPQVRRDLSFAVVDGERVVAYAVLEEPAPGIGEHAITAVRRAHHGRGLARTLKQAQIAAAKAAGLRELHAANTVTNAPMRALNERLGYRPTLLDVHLEGPLPSGSAARCVEASSARRLRRRSPS